MRRDDARADRQQVADQRDRGHARAGDDRARAALEIGERRAEQVARRIAGARVVVRALLAEAPKAKVELRWIGGTTAPVSASVSRPARTARVARSSDLRWSRRDSPYRRGE